MTAPLPRSILFICMGNICRSPTVEAVARRRFADAGLAIEVASAGTEDYHIGAAADPSARRLSSRTLPLLGRSSSAKR